MKKLIMATLVSLAMSSGLWADNYGGLNDLMIASIDGKYGKVVEIVNAKTYDVNAKTGSGRTALMFACIMCYSNIADFLLKNNADATIYTPEGNSAFSFAKDALNNGHDCNETLAVLAKYDIME